MSMSCLDFGTRPIRNLRSEPEELPPAGILENCGVSSGSLSLQTQWLDWTIKLMPPLRPSSFGDPLKCHQWSERRVAVHWGKPLICSLENYIWGHCTYKLFLVWHLTGVLTLVWLCVSSTYSHVPAFFYHFSHSLGRCHPSIRMAGHWHQSGSSGTARSAMP